MHLAGPVLTPAQIATPRRTTTSRAVAQRRHASPARRRRHASRAPPATGSPTASSSARRVTINGAAGSWTRDRRSRTARQTLERLALATARLPRARRDRRPTSDGRRRRSCATVTADDVPVATTVADHDRRRDPDFGGYVTRADGGTWAADGFHGRPARDDRGHRRLVAPAPDLSTTARRCTLERGAVLPTIATPTTRMVFWPGPHGGLTVVHGGGNSRLEINFEMDVDRTASPSTRLDGRSWTDAGFVDRPDSVQVGGAGTDADDRRLRQRRLPVRRPVPGLRRRQHDAAHRRRPLDAGAGADQRQAGRPRRRAGAGRRRRRLMNITVQPTGRDGLPTSTLTCVAASCFDVTGTSGTVFKPGMQVYDLRPRRPVHDRRASTPTSMVLQGAALTPTLRGRQRRRRVFTPIELTVSGYDADFDGGVRDRRRHDHRLQPAPTSPSRAAARTALERSPGPNSPLVVYGDTSQDGVWYGGRPVRRPGLRVRPEAVRPVLRRSRTARTRTTSGSSRSPTRTTSPATTSSTPAACSPVAARGACALPSVGFTAYGGAGNDLIIGSQAGDHLAGGSGDDTILGLRGVDHIYGDSGVNVNILTRGLHDRHDEPQPGADARRERPASSTTAPTIEPAPVAGRATTDGRRPRR